MVARFYMAANNEYQATVFYLYIVRYLIAFRRLYPSSVEMYHTNKKETTNFPPQICSSGFVLLATLAMCRCPFEYTRISNIIDKFKCLAPGGVG